jgi:hypothetical protein
MSIPPHAQPPAGSPAAPLTADGERAAHWQAIAHMNPATLHARIRTALSIVQARPMDEQTRLDLERVLSGFGEAA